MQGPEEGISGYRKGGNGAVVGFLRVGRRTALRFSALRWLRLVRVNDHRLSVVLIAHGLERGGGR
jgi:hypothetical protein